MSRCRKPAVGQKGSLMVIVLAFSIVLVLAAGSLVLVVGNSRGDEDGAYKRVGCFNDAESGLLIGVGWLRNSPGSRTLITTDQFWPGNAMVLFSDFPADNGSLVTVTIIDNVPGGAPTKTVVSRAVSGTETTQLSWDIGAATTGGPANDGTATDGLPIMTLTKWRTP